MGVYTESTNTTVSNFKCNVQPNNTDFANDKDGDVLTYKYRVNCPRLSYSVPWQTQLVSLSFEGKALKVKSFFNFQKHAELKVD